MEKNPLHHEPPMTDPRATDHYRLEKTALQELALTKLDDNHPRQFYLHGLKCF